MSNAIDPTRVRRWRRAGPLLSPSAAGWGEQVLGDPCIVWDDDVRAWRMFLFALPPGHAHALCTGDPFEPRAWSLAGPLTFVNPEALAGGAAFKPFVVLDAEDSPRAARIGGRFALLLVVDASAKAVQRAWSTSLAGPWTVEASILIPRGSGDDFDARHVDAVSGYYFRERDEILYFYMGYPEHEQPQSRSPFGSAQGAAVESVDSGTLRKHGPILRPSDAPGHWAAGWIGGLQLLRSTTHKWCAVLNASPTAPDRRDTRLWSEEPPPSLPGMAVCDEEFPIQGWRLCDEPLEWVDDIPAEARTNGEGTNLWRHFALVANGRAALFYNSGSYFQERLFLKLAEL